MRSSPSQAQSGTDTPGGIITAQALVISPSSTDVASHAARPSVTALFAARTGRRSNRVRLHHVTRMRNVAVQRAVERPQAGSRCVASLPGRKRF